MADPGVPPIDPASLPAPASAVSPPEARRRAGYVALVGRPNAGKSTLMNQMVGEHLSIVTPKAQTTWRRVTGLLTRGEAQLIFLDTPGLLEPRDLLQRSMLAAAEEALGEADVVLLVIDASRAPRGGEEGRIAEALVPVTVPVHVALNKVDAADPEVVARWRQWVADHLRGSVHEVSARTGAGVAPLLDALAVDLPESPFLYPEDDLAIDPVRFFVAELVREAVFELYDQEIPYSVLTQVQDFREAQDPAYISVELLVERPSQKGILIGRGGAAIRELGTRAREKIEHFLGRRVYLDLWVKPLKGWRRSRAHLGAFGFRVPEDTP